MKRGQFNTLEVIGLGKEAMKAQMSSWLNEYLVEDYTIDENYFIDVDGNVDLRDFDIVELPSFINFGCVKTFYINNNPKLKSKRGFPQSALYVNCKGTLVGE